MPRELFGDATGLSHAIGTRRWYSVQLSFVAHTAALVPMIALPILAPELLPIPRQANVFIAAAPAPPDPPAPVARAAPPSSPPNVNAAPVVPPDNIAPETGLETAMPSTPVTVSEFGLPGAAVVGDATIVEPPPAAPPRQEPYRIGGDIKAPTKISGAAPIYPPLAQAAHVEGVVIIEAVIGEDGRVERAHVLRSVPLLDHAALDAVRQWIYRPTTLNGVAVPVVMTVTVHFTLRR